MARTPLTFSLPPFRGMTRRIILSAVGTYFVLLVLRWMSAPTADTVEILLFLHPDQALFRCLWQFFSYPFVNLGLMSLLLGCLSLWFFAAALEEERGGKWLAEYFLAATAGGGVLLCVVSRTVFRHDTHGMEPTASAYGIWGAVLAVLLAYAHFHPDQEIRFNFIIGIKAKYLAAIYVLIYLANALTSAARMQAAAAICAGVAGFAFLRLAPRQGVRHGLSEGWYGVRNAYYRRKRQRAAKKFTVYMKKQGRDVNFDSSGKYIPQDEERRNPDDKRWMN